MLTRILTIIVCGAGGYFATITLRDSPAKPVEEPIVADSGPIVELNVPPAAESAFIAEWDEIRAKHGDDFATMYAAFKDAKDAFRRRAFRSALIAEWSVLDPKSALAFLMENDMGNVGLLTREWLRRDPHGAINGLLGGGEKAVSSLRGLLSEIAQVAPARLVEVVAAIKPATHPWDTSTDDAFAIFAKADPAGARAATESLTGAARDAALAGVTKEWAGRDNAAALAWAEALPPGEARNRSLRAVISVLVIVDAMAALEKLDLAPPNGREGYGNDFGADVLAQAAKKDWDGTLAWLRANPDKLGSNSLNGLRDEMTRRLGNDTDTTMRLLSGSDSTGLRGVFQMAVINDGYAHRDVIWAWLDGQRPSERTRELQGALLSAMGFKEPLVAMEFLERIPDTPENSKLLSQGVRSLFNGGERMGQFESLIENASGTMRTRLLEAGFDRVSRSLSPSEAALGRNTPAD